MADDSGGHIAKDLTVDQFERLRDYIHHHSGIYLENGKLDSLRISVVTRATRLGIQSFDAYFQHLVDVEAEFRELLDLVTINETSFFRFPQQFEVLKKRVIPELVERKRSASRSLRFWSAGCSTGEEAYTIAMTALDSGIEQLGRRPSVTGTDVSTKALAVARAGLYSGKRLDNVPEDVDARYFVRKAGGLRVAPVVRRIVDFGFHNLIKEPYPLSLMGDWDVIFCRNVTIYFRLESTKRVVHNFYNSLNEGGYLFIGHSETLSSISEEFEPVEVDGVFLYRKTTPKRSILSVDLPSTRERKGVPRIPGGERKTVGADRERIAPRRTSAAERAEEPAERAEEPAERAEEPAERAEEPAEREALLREARDHISLGEHDRARAILEEVLERYRGDPQAHLLLAFSHADSGDLETAAGEARKALDKDPLLPGARYVLAVISQRRGDLVGAVSEFKKTIYIDPDFVLAHLNLANLYKAQAKWDQACRAYENALRSLYVNPEGSWVEFMGGFRTDLLAKTCERSLVECRKAMGVV